MVLSPRASCLPMMHLLGSCCPTALVSTALPLMLHHNLQRWEREGVSVDGATCCLT